MEGFRLLELAGAAAMTRWCVVALAGLLSAVKAWASPSDAFFPLNQAIAVIADSPGESPFPENGTRCVLWFRTFEDRFVASQLQVPDDYKKTLNFDASLLRMASESKGGKAEVELLNEVLEDLRAKDVASQGKGMQDQHRVHVSTDQGDHNNHKQRNACARLLGSLQSSALR